MILSVYAPRPDLTAAAYLLEIIIAEFLFLGPYRKRGSFTGRVIAVHVLLLILSAVTGIPRQAGFPRFLWFFAAMSACIAAVCACYDENAFTLTSACVAGFATQHIANKFTLMLDLIPVASRISDQSVFLHALFEVLIFSYILTILDIDNTPLMLGMILEDIMEKNFVTASMAYNRDYTIFVRRPISLVILVLTVLLLVSLMRMNKKIEALNQANIEAMAAEHAEMEKEEAEKKAAAE